MSHMYQRPYDEGFADGQEAANRIAKLEADRSKAWETCQKAVERGMALEAEVAELEKELEETQWMYQGLVEENAKLWLTGGQADLREAAQNVLEDVENGPIGKTDLCLTQLASLLEVKDEY